jgi:hypothetical protein
MTRQKQQLPRSHTGTNGPPKKLPGSCGQPTRKQNPSESLANERPISPRIKKPFETKIGETMWTVRNSTRLTAAHGWCDEGKEEIVIYQNLTLRRHVEVLIHECLHALSFKLFSEEWILDAAKDISDTLVDSTPELKRAIKNDDIKQAAYWRKQHKRKGKK